MNRGEAMHLKPIIEKVLALKGEADRKRAISVFVIAIVFIVGGLIFGIANNFVGPLLFIGGLGVLVIAFLQNWASIRVFIYLLIGAVIGFGFFAMLHNLLYGISMRYADTELVQQILEGSHAFFFFLGVVLCPAVFIAGLIGILMRAFQQFNTGN